MLIWNHDEGCSATWRWKAYSRWSSAWGNAHTKKNLKCTNRSKLQTIERDLKSVVFGQDKAIEVLASAVKMARSGLGKTDKPIGSFLFSGPTGVGKTVNFIKL